MKAKWENRTYIDLYAGAGYNKIEGTKKIIAGSRIHALQVKDPFDNHIFCEEDAKKLGALQRRVAHHAPWANVSYIEGDCNFQVQQILAAIPSASPGYGVLSLCFVDPFDIGIKFETLRALSDRYIDFLVLLALYMDANRARAHYVKEESAKIDEFLGSTAWRDRMETLRYLPTPLHAMPIVRDDDNHPLYRLSLFSRHQRAHKLWEQALKYSTDQTTLPF
jgi:three-Cys-motif partner protein